MTNQFSFLAKNGMRDSHAKHLATKLITSYFTEISSHYLLSKLHFSMEPTKLTIRFYYYVGGTPNPFVVTDLSQLSSVLTKLFGKEVILQATQLHYPYLESSILAQYLAHNASSNTFLHFQEAILSYPSYYASSLPSYITGIKVQLSGRISTEPVVPRMTTKSTQLGSFSTHLMDYSNYTTKNELGTFSIKVWIAQCS